MNNQYRCWAEVDLDALRSNLAWIRHRVGPRVKIMTVVKADAYGHGLKQIAALLMQSGTDIFGVANLAEARSIHTVGRGWPVLMLGSCLPEEIEPAVRDGIMPAISSFEEAARFSEAGKKLEKTVAVHVKVDTGMGRLGEFPEQVLSLIRKVLTLPAVQIQGLMTHYSSVEDDLKFSMRQRGLFQKVLTSLESEGIIVPLIHCNNSGALLLEETTLFNLVRPGLLVYGIAPPARRRFSTLLHRHLKPALSWKSRVSLVREVPKGTPISYGHTFRTARKSRLAVVTAGYGDGYFRSAGNHASVLIEGKRCQVLGRVTMDQMVVDVSACRNVKTGDEVVLIGRQKKEEITAIELAQWCDTIPWEVLTNITYRVPRIYKGGHAA